MADEVRYAARGPGFSLFLTSDGAALRTADRVARMRVHGARRDAVVEPVHELSGKINYFIGRDHWRTNIPTFSRVRYRRIYDGIDLVFYVHDRELEYDFVVSPGVSPDRIELAFSDAAVRIDAEGNLAAGPLRWRKPVAYQEVNGKRREVTARFVVRGERVGFETGVYDPRLPLVIDPVLEYSKFIGGTYGDQITRVKVDSGGNAYVAGATWSRDLASPGTAQQTPSDVFLAKISPLGAMIWLNYVGGTNVDTPRDMVLDGNNNIYVAGQTYSSDFPKVGGLDLPIVSNLHAFLFKFNTLGTQLTLSTLLGAASDARGVAVGADGAICVTGTVSPSLSGPLLLLNPLRSTPVGTEGFVMKLNAAGNLPLYSTYLGGAGSDYPQAIAVDAQGAAYVAGITDSSDFASNRMQQRGGLLDCFVARIDPAGSALSYAARIGGAGNDFCAHLSVDNAGRVTVVGNTESLDFPLQNAIQTTLAGITDAFVARLNPAGSDLEYSTFLGGRGNDAAVGVALDGAGNAYVTGNTNGGLPLVNPLQATKSGGSNLLVRTTDSGDNWAVLGGPITGSGIQSIAVDPTNTAVLHAASSDCVGYRSSNAGDTWESRVSGLCSSYAVLPNGITIAASSLGVLRSLDHGLTWTNLDHNARGDRLASGAAGVFLGNSQTIYKSTDSGATWTSANLGQFVYSIAPHPTNPSIVYAATGDLLRSDDGGLTWTTPSVRWTGRATAVHFVPANPEFLFVVVDGQLWRVRIAGYGPTEALPPLPAPVTAVAAGSIPGLMFAGTDGRGVFRSTDYGTRWAAVANGIADTSVQVLATDPANPARLYAGLRLQQDAFVVKIGPSGPLLWSTYLGGSGLEDATSIAAQTDGTVYVAGAVYIYDDIPSSDFPYTTARRVQPLGNEPYTTDSFLAKISPLAAACNPQLVRQATDVPGRGGATYVNVIAPAGCAWTLSTPSWVSVAGSGSGTGLATVQLTVAQNGGLARSGSVTLSPSGSSITIAQQAAILPLISPANGSQQSAVPTLQWSAVAGATRYIASVSPNAPGEAGWSRDLTSLSTTWEPLATGITYYWRVVAETPAGLVYSAWWSFEVPVPAATITLLSPLNNATNVSLRPTFSWSPVAGVANYDLQYGKSSPPTEIAHNTNAGTFTFSGDLDPDTVYYWRVVARNNEAQPSAIWSFRTAPRLGPVTPASGTAHTATFTVDYAVGQRPYTAVFFLMNATLDARNACAVYFNPGENRLSLLDNAGNNWISQPSGDSTLLRNSQCALNLQASSASVTNTLIRLQLTLRFEDTFAGAKNTYLLARTTQGDVGWHQTSTWNVPAAQALLGPVTPSSGSGARAQLTADFAHVTGPATVTGALLIVNPTSGTEHGCVVFFDPIVNRFHLSNDAGTGWIAAPGSTPVENSQCELEGARTASWLGFTLRITVGLRFKPSFVGQKTVSLTLKTRSGDIGPQVAGSWSVQTDGPAVAGPLSPDNGTGTAQSFSAQFSHPAGGSAFTSAFVSINWSLSPQRGCVVYYQPGAFGLLDDAGSGWLFPGPGGLVENSQCSLNTAQSTASVSGNRLTLNLVLTFKPAFAGGKEIYLLGRTAGGDVGWTRAGAWTVPGATPSVGPFTPSEGVGSTQVFSAFYRNPNGADGFVGAFALINWDLVATGSCTVYYEPSQARFYLLDDAGINWGVGGRSGGGILQNSQCSLDLAHTSASAYGTQLILQLGLTFKPGFAGVKRMYQLGRTYSADTGWQHVGKWTVPAGIAAVGPVTPASGAGSSQVFSAPFQYPGGGTAFTGAFLLINSDLVATQSCTAYYNPASARFHLLNDAGTDWGSGAAAGSGILQNSQCALDLSRTSVLLSGPTLTWNAAIVFKPAFRGSKRIYLLGRTPAGDIGWQQAGVWIVP